MTNLRVEVQPGESVHREGDETLVFAGDCYLSPSHPEVPSAITVDEALQQLIRDSSLAVVNQIGRAHV